jgi:hypothetical protein
MTGGLPMMLAVAWARRRGWPQFFPTPWSSCPWPPESGALVLKADVEADRRDFVVLDGGQALQEGQIVHDGSTP